MNALTEYIASNVQPTDRYQRIEHINQVLLEIAEGNYNHIAPISDEFDEIDAIASGVNMLSEELRDTVISRNYLDSVLRSTVDILIIFDEQFFIQQITPKTCEFLQRSEEVLIGQPMSSLFDGRKKAFVQRLKNSLYLTSQLHHIETSFKIPRKEKLPVTLSLFSIQNNRGVTTGYLMAAEDIKQIHQTTNALKQKNEELKTLIYRASHDLKGPLASMLGLFQVLEYEEQNIPTLKLYLSYIKKSAEKLNNTLMDLLEVGMIDQPIKSFHPFAIHDTIEDIISSLDNYPGREKVNVKMKVDNNIMLVSSEKILRSVIQNLIENSIKYRQFNEDIQCETLITCRAQQDEVVLTVRDNGQGMDKNVVKKAFDMFFRGTQDSNGSGLGLFIVKSNVEKLGGKIKIKSKVRKGTEISISLPIGD